ncbi:uncharacterized protein YigA (DUF484 family) [Sphingomicrobium lutaoense]|uniref:Uncharacterized protein YigA (DUF484 family) n=1 Tax=Sphingomicrobium lutaoense TaxID=515949 RepID=A0A839YYC8_9SPHN|nr:DUF484 domain-containing protein [Sphingomicrobium lutaoense]MBB3764016.1 uncharacterized protein YigA (DUF484 family) [Sphingomicrobium lutaoense]
MAKLRHRLGEAEEARANLAAFAAGHHAATAAIHAAVVEAASRVDLAELAETVTQRWPAILGVDACAFALIISGEGFRFDRKGVFSVEPQWIRSAGEGDEIQLSSERRGDPLFGEASGQLRSQAVIRISGPASVEGVLLLGQSSDDPVGSPEGNELLCFLGRALGAMIGRCIATK